VIHRGDVYDADFPIAGHHPGVVVTREIAIPVLASVTMVTVTSTIRGHRAEVSLGKAEGLDHESVANCDEVFTLPKTVLARFRGRLGPERLAAVDRALMFALELD
jgi:mRNA interferase MazF